MFSIVNLYRYCDFMCAPWCKGALCSLSTKEKAGKRLNTVVRQPQKRPDLSMNLAAYISQRPP